MFALSRVTLLQAFGLGPPTRRLWATRLAWLALCWSTHTWAQATLGALPPAVEDALQRAKLPREALRWGRVA